MWVLLLLLLSATPTWAKTVYVGVGGTQGNCNNTTTTSRMPTLSSGLPCLVPGDTLSVGSGLYREVVNLHGVKGNESQEITLKSEVLHGAHLAPFSMGGSGGTGIVTMCDTSYVTLDGFDIDGSDTGTQPGGLLTITAAWLPPCNAHHVTIINNDIHHIYDNDTSNSGVCIQGGAPDSYMAFNTIHHCGYNAYPTCNCSDYPGCSTIGQNGSCDGNCSATCEGRGYAIYGGGDDMIIEYNEMYFTSGYPVHQYSGGGSAGDRTIWRNNYIHDGRHGCLFAAPGDDVQVYNNIFARLGQGQGQWGSDLEAVMIGGGFSGSQRTLVYNNTLAFNVAGSMTIGHNGRIVTNARVFNNLLWQNGSDTIQTPNAPGIALGNNLTSNPSFEEPSGAAKNSFRLTAQSTDYIDQGNPTVATVVTTDAYGNNRPYPPGGNWDVGAHEYGSTTVVTGALPAYWHFDENTGLTATDALNNHVLSWTLGPTWAPPGKVGTSALHCNGTSPGANNSENLTLSQYSWMLWYRGGQPADLSVDRQIFSTGGHFGLFWSSNDPCCIGAQWHRLSDGSYLNPPPRMQTPLQQGVWYHLAGTWDGATVRLYLNGTLQQTASASSVWPSEAGLNICVGQSAPVTGDIDEFQIYNTVKTQTEIQANYQLGVTTQRRVSHHKRTLQ